MVPAAKLLHSAAYNLHDFSNTVEKTMQQHITNKSVATFKAYVLKIFEALFNFTAQFSQCIQTFASNIERNP